MFDMATVTLGANLNSPMGLNGHQHGQHLPVGNLTPQSALKYSPHSPMSTPSSTPHSNSNSNGKSSTGGKDVGEVFGSKCKRKINFSHLGIPKGTQPATVARRNARERNRVKQVNNGFSALKQHIPLSHRSKKMSKVETLRCAVDYIKNLKDMLELNGALLGSSSTRSESGEHHFSAGDIENLHQHLTYATTNHNQLSPTSSDDPSSPSYASEASYITSTGSSNPNPNNANSSNNNNNMYDYENYEPVSPEDEELLDAISWWQQS